MGMQDLTALVGSRICHDLVGPLGAIGNGVELLTMANGAPGAEMDLISESVVNATARLRFFRIAFGAAADHQLIPRSEVLSVLAAASPSGRHSYLWEPREDLPRTELRVAFLVIQCLETALPHGGDIQIRRGGTDWTIIGDSARLSVDPALWDSLTAPGARVPLTPALVQFALLPGALAEAQRSLSIQRGSNRIEIGF